MSNFKDVFRFLDLYGGTSFIADVNKNNYDEERYKNITNLKVLAYDEVWKNLFLQISPYLKDKDKKQVYKIQNWQNSGKIYNYFWIQIKDKEKLNYASSISIVAGKEGIYIKVEYQYTSKNTINTVVNHNKYILSLDKWKENYNINLDKYYVYYDSGLGQEKISLNDFMENQELRNSLEGKIKNNENIRIVIQKEFDKDYILNSSNFELEIAQSINELDYLYEKAIENDSVSENIEIKFIEDIRSQKMSKSYKIALLSCFIDENQIKNTITYDEIYTSLKKYYFVENHRQDLSEIKDLEQWNKDKYIRKMKETAIKYLPGKYFILDETNETYSLCNEISTYVTQPSFVQAYKDAVEFLENKYFGDGAEVVVERITNKSQKEVIDHILNYMTDQGYIYDKELISNLYLSLKTKPFVILAGISGTGKSKIVRLFAEALRATVENNQYNMISVRPDWNDSTELIGYKNLESKFIKGKLTQIIEEAVQNLDKPYFVCLDEMNLARVEYYLSDYLSIIESRRKVGDKIITDKLIYDTEISDEKSLSLPENLYLIGTVNMDDTTFQFSRKVLDRANTIEFSEVNLENLFGENSAEDNLDENIEVYNDFLKSTYLKNIDIEDDYRNYAIEINKKIIEINNILKKSQKQFAYRVRDEILFYMIENKKANLLDENEAFDYQIMQKVLPAISGSENSVKETLVNLFNFVCEKEILNDSDIEEAEQFLNSQDIKYKKSAEKIIYMLKGYNYDGYASYWY
ncbi:McrB family protein [Terrisporobacter sp.]|uniref:McrB family protein n=1 Tax=Terrisporobacter sp. TaxID=1965305 RepID=UPI003993EE58